jgi:hypothetical protein
VRMLQLRAGRAALDHLETLARAAAANPTHQILAE